MIAGVLDVGGGFKEIVERQFNDLSTSVSDRRRLKSIDPSCPSSPTRFSSSIFSISSLTRRGPQYTPAHRVYETYWPTQHLAVTLGGPVTVCVWPCCSPQSRGSMTSRRARTSLRQTRCNEIMTSVSPPRRAEGEWLTVFITCSLLVDTAACSCHSFQRVNSARWIAAIFRPCIQYCAILRRIVWKKGNGTC